MINLRTAQLSVGANSFSPVTGISYIVHRDTLVVSLADGSFHVVSNLTKLAPTCPSSDIAVNSETLSVSVRTLCSSLYPDGLLPDDVNQINGMILYDEGSTVVWVHEYVLLTFSWFFSC